MAEGALRELLVRFGVEVETEKLDQFHEKLHESIGMVKEWGMRLVEVFGLYEAKEFFEHQIEQGTELVHMAERLGLSTDSLQKFQYAAKLAGISAESAAHSLMIFNRHVGDAVTGGGEGGKAFQKLGIHIKDAHGQVRQLDDLLPELADKIKELPSHQEKAAMAMQLFGRQGSMLLPMLEKGSAGIAELSKEFEELGGGVSKNFLEQSIKAEEAQAKLNLGWQHLKTTLLASVIPWFTKFVDKMTDLVKVGVGVVDHTNALAHAFQFLKAVGIVAVLLKIVDVLAVIDLEEVFAALPIVLAVAAVVALYLAFDDLATMMEGDKSVLGDFFTEIEGLEGKERFIISMTESWENLKKAIHDVMVALGLVKEAEDSSNDGWRDMKELIVDLAHGFDLMINGMAHAIEVMLKISKGDFAGALKEVRTAAMETVEKSTGKKFADPDQAWEQAKHHFMQTGFGNAVKPEDVPQMFDPLKYQKFGTARLAGGAAKEAGNAVVHQTNNIKVEVHPSGDEKIAGDVKKHVNGAMDKQKDQMIDALNALRKQ